LPEAEPIRLTDVADRRLDLGARGDTASCPSWVHDLSPRDVWVLRLLSEGRSTAGIAEELAYSESTIKNVIHDLVRQLGARNRAHAVALAIRAGLI
jgi:DNA-binding NarL/FixJ family response regulator